MFNSYRRAVKATKETFILFRYFQPAIKYQNLFVLDLSKHIVNNYEDVEELMHRGNSVRYVVCLTLL